MRVKTYTCPKCGCTYEFTGPLKHTVCPECGAKPQCTGENYKKTGGKGRN